MMPPQSPSMMQPQMANTMQPQRPTMQPQIATMIQPQVPTMQPQMAYIMQPQMPTMQPQQQRRSPFGQRQRRRGQGRANQRPPHNKLDAVQRRLNTSTNGFATVFQYDGSTTDNDTAPISRYDAAPTDDATTISQCNATNTMAKIPPNELWVGIWNVMQPSKGAM